MLRACHFSLISNSTYELIRTGRTRGFFADVNMPPSLKCQIGQGRERGWLCWRRIKGVTPSHTFKALLVCLSDVREPLCLVEQLTCRLLFAARASIRSVGGKKGGCDRIRHIKWLTLLLLWLLLIRHIKWLTVNLRLLRLLLVRHIKWLTPGSANKIGTCQV